MVHNVLIILFWFERFVAKQITNRLVSQFSGCNFYSSLLFFQLNNENPRSYEPSTITLVCFLLSVTAKPTRIHKKIWQKDQPFQNAFDPCGHDNMFKFISCKSFQKQLFFYSDPVKHDTSEQRLLFAQPLRLLQQPHLQPAGSNIKEWQTEKVRACLPVCVAGTLRAR